MKNNPLKAGRHSLRQTALSNVYTRNTIGTCLGGEASGGLGGDHCHCTYVMALGVLAVRSRKKTLCPPGGESSAEYYYRYI